MREAGRSPLIVLAIGSIGPSMALADWRDLARGPVAGKALIADMPVSCLHEPLPWEWNAETHKAKAA